MKRENIKTEYEEEEEKSQPKPKKETMGKTQSKLNFKKRPTMFIKNLNEFNKLRGSIDTKVKFQKYDERRNNFLEVMHNNFKKKLDKNNLIRLNAEKKKKMEFEDNRIINTYSQLIKQNYTIQKF